MGRHLDGLEDEMEDAFRAVEADGMPRYLPSMTQGGECMHYSVHDAGG